MEPTGVPGAASGHETTCGQTEYDAGDQPDLRPRLDACDGKATAQEQPDD